MRIAACLVLLAMPCALAAQAPTGIEATSFSGKPLVSPPPAGEAKIRLEAAYHARLLLYKGLRTPESMLNLNTADDIQIATQGYGAGNWYLVNGDRARAKAIFDRVLAGKAWTAFGFIAAEADVTRGF